MGRYDAPVELVQTTRSTDGFDCGTFASIQLKSSAGKIIVSETNQQRFDNCHRTVSQTAPDRGLLRL
ncbi:hypothetical protein CLOSTMETH_00451 [[Clostridium] methylpentosum DSM 5476]|uniref:Uncharacterized protein n=1 Tax=[Clostridium] methylpentosum DSM 5476 TaxID=537013 RepID=C0E9F2_9FIRM|nr:hypothetical protein CLOSTMETH_00451 [[Clostridium] methylpentosum DSM 5476]